MNFSSDLCTLSTLTESALLCSIETRCRGELTESYVGGVLLSLGPSNKITGPQFVPSFASSVLRSLAFTHEGQSILISGYHGMDKKTLSNDLLGALLSHVEQQIPSLGSSVLMVSELLGYLSYSDENNPCGAVLVTTLFINSTNLMLTAARVSCLLLDTKMVSLYKVFRDPNGFNHVKSCLFKLGMDPGQLQQVCLVLKTIQELLTKTTTAQALSNMSVTKLPNDLPAENSLVQLLYAYLVQWIVSWANSNCLRVGRQSGSSFVSLVCAPGHCFSSEESSTLSALIMRYSNEVLHNIYCNRLFVWEQEQYLEEGIEWDEVEVEFNESLINCLHQEDGSLLQVLGLSDRDAMRTGVERCCRVSGDSCFILGQDKDRFALAHFTGEYEYVVDEKWAETDRVQIVSHGLQASLLTSSCGVLVEMAQNMHHSADLLPHFEKMTACAFTQRAKQAMDSVCELLTTSQPHFVLCFKPSKNGRKNFNCDFVLNQLQQFKVLDIALIQSCGFPVRLQHSNFLKNYGALYVGGNTPVLSDQEKCVVILESSHLKEWHVGLTMVMLKPWHLRQLDSTLDLFNQSAKKLQKAFKQSIHKKRQSLSTSSLLAPSPPPRPSHTLPTQTGLTQPVTHPPPPRTGDYDKASSPRSSPRSVSPQKKKMSWKQSSPSHASKPSATSSTNLETFVWFQGKLSRERAEERLQEVQFDCFLIRESESRVGEYALSLRHNSSIKHFRIDTKLGLTPRYEVYGAKRSFPSLDVLVDYYSDHCISSGGELLKTPYSTEKQEPPTGHKRKLSSIRRPKPSLVTITVKERSLPRTNTTPSLDSPRAHLPPKRLSFDTSDEPIAMLQRELEVEERIVEAARRMAELPTSNRRERQKRKQSLQQAQSRLLSLKKQFHTLQERKRFIEISMMNENQ